MYRVAVVIHSKAAIRKNVLFFQPSHQFLTCACGDFVSSKKKQIGRCQQHDKETNLCSTDSWAKLAAIDLLVIKSKSGSSQSQQILPTHCWSKFAAIDLFVNQETANRSNFCQHSVSQNLLRSTCSWLSLNPETANRRKFGQHIVSQNLLRSTCSWLNIHQETAIAASFAPIDLFVVISKSGSSQSQQILPTQC